MSGPLGLLLGLLLAAPPAARFAESTAVEVELAAVESALAALDTEFATFDAARAAPATGGHVAPSPAEDDRFAGRTFCALDDLARRLDALPLTQAVRDRGWIRLRRVEAGLYPLLNRRATRLAAAGSAPGPIPVTFDNRHNVAAQRWVRLAAAGFDLGDAVLHVDSHPDARGFARLDDLIRAKQALARDPADVAARATLGEVLHDINHPLVAAAFLGARHVVWLAPPWAVVRGDHGLALAVVRPGPGSGLDPDECPPGGLCFQLDEAATGRAAVRRFLSGLPRAHRATGAGLRGGTPTPPERLADVSFSIVADGGPRAAAPLLAGLPGDRFLLSLDLDAFTTEGRAHLPGSPCSPGRVSPDCAGEPAAPARRLAAFEAERRAVNARLARFAAHLRVLAAAGKRPTLVSIADSTWLQDTRCAECDSVEDYTPPDFVAHVRHRALAALAAAWPAAGLGPCAAEPARNELPAPAAPR